MARGGLTTWEEKVDEMVAISEAQRAQLPLVQALAAIGAGIGLMRDPDRCAALENAQMHVIRAFNALDKATEKEE